MPEFYTLAILLIHVNQSEEIGEKQLSIFGFRRGQISLLMHVALYFFQNCEHEIRVNLE